MRALRPAALLGSTFLAVCMVAASAAQAQWMPTGAPVCTAPGPQTSPAISVEGAGGTVIAWNDGRGTAPGVYVQPLDSSGLPARSRPPRAGRHVLALEGRPELKSGLCFLRLLQGGESLRARVVLMR